ncbi:toll/interleukin-1 receptor domain-containing protein [uncultured Rheinheimera sp.]|uniref:toll/interleukin-1 receptor domain-containing protein n=1 Tax=uncultured Rheinheimera sp. TaxID=400532 RepID=UPI0025979E6D|nr:toll/interleukin-1 receptor domain-containing protein [uncultured Rheinheimera sp.]
MFTDLKLKNVEDNRNWSDKDVERYKQKKGKEYEIQIEKYLLNENNTLDADIISSELFPQVDADVFISHSHSDEDKAIKLALSLEKIGLETFVDSCVWGYADDLLRKIDNKFSLPRGAKYYDYELRNKTTTNVHMILNSALHEMIDRSELFIFLESENSVKIDDYIKKSEYLSSPWIFSELAFAGRVQRKPRRQIELMLKSFKESFESVSSEKRDVEFAYNIPKLTNTIEFSSFQNWIRAKPANRTSDGYIDALEHLDRLYKKLKIHPDLLKAPRIKA